MRLFEVNIPLNAFEVGIKLLAPFQIINLCDRWCHIVVIT